MFLQIQPFTLLEKIYYFIKHFLFKKFNFFEKYTYSASKALQVFGFHLIAE